MLININSHRTCATIVLASIACLASAGSAPKYAVKPIFGYVFSGSTYTGNAVAINDRGSVAYNYDKALSGGGAVPRGRILVPTMTPKEYTALELNPPTGDGSQQSESNVKAINDKNEVAGWWMSYEPASTRYKRGVFWNVDQVLSVV